MYWIPNTGVGEYEIKEGSFHTEYRHTPKVEAYCQFSFLNSVGVADQYGYTGFDSTVPQADWMGSHNPERDYGGNLFVGQGVSDLDALPVRESAELKPRLSVRLSIRSEHTLYAKTTFQSALDEKTYQKIWDCNYNSQQTDQPFQSHDYHAPGVESPQRFYTDETPTGVQYPENSYSNFALKSDTNRFKGQARYFTFDHLLTAEQTESFLAGNPVTLNNVMRYYKNDRSSNSYQQPYYVEQLWNDDNHEYNVTIQGEFS